MTSKNPIEFFFPEVGAGGFSRVDGTMAFYTRVNALVHPEMVVVDLGAGRGAGVRNEKGLKRYMRDFRGRVRKVIGLDVDPIVKENPSLDDAYVIGSDGLFPLADESVDLIFSDFTFEHINDPNLFASEVERILKSGGWICARTPNKWGYIGIGARLIPNILHTRFLKVLQPHRKEIDVFPVVYKLNTFASLRTHFPDGRWKRFIYTQDPEPAYFGSSKIFWGLMLMVSWLSPPPFRAALLIYIQKR